MKRSLDKFLIFLSFFCTINIFNLSYAFASGQGDIKPLSYVSCTLEDGSKIDDVNGISIQPKFTLLFDKNVVDMLVWNNNSTCIKLSNSDNTNVAIDVTKIDDTVDFNHRQEIYVNPIDPLTSEKTYQLYISPNLTAKNGVATLGGTTDGKGITITFKTKKLEVSQNTNVTPVANQNVNQGNISTNTTEQSKDASSTSTSANSTNVNASTVQGSANLETESTAKANASTAKTNENTSNSNTSTSITTESAPANKTNQNTSNANNQSLTSEQVKVQGKENNQAASEPKDTSSELIYIILVLLISAWIIVEVLVKKRGRIERRNKPKV
jgi:hypothetical protein